MRLMYLIFVIFITSCSSNLQQVSDPIRSVKEIDDISVIRSVLNNLSESSVLLVLDIDDTLLTSREFFGSDKWYEWQKEIGDEKAPCVFDILGIVFEIGTNKLAQEKDENIKENTLEVIESISTDILVLTARSEKYRASTSRELIRNGFSFSENHLNANYQPVRFEAKERDRKTYVSYMDGVFMVSGMNKGEMLLDLLRRIERYYDVIVFVDDKLKNIKNMKNALHEKNIDLYAFHYTRVDKSITEKEIEEGEQALAQLLNYMDNNFKFRADQIRKSECSY